MAVFGDILSNELKENYYIPPSTIFPYAGTAVGGTAPAGWLFCDGSSVGTSTYPNLFSAIGYSYGGSGASFTLPDLRGRVIAGRDIDNGSGYSGRLSTMSNQGSVIAAAGGSETHTLGTAEMPTHGHGVGTITAGTTNFAGGHDHTVSGNTASGTTSLNLDHNHTIVPGDGIDHVFVRPTSPDSYVRLYSTGASGTGYTTVGQASRGMSLNLLVQGRDLNHSHSFSATTSSMSAHSHSVTGTVTMNNAGSSTSHNNVQPTMVMNYIIKV
jgi:microcystin-dependent protein